MTFATLAAKACLTHWEMATWFPHAELKGTVLVLPDDARADTVTRCYLPLLRVYVPALTVTVRHVTSRPTASRHGVSAFKKGHEPRDSDLLD